MEWFLIAVLAYCSFASIHGIYEQYSKFLISRELFDLIVILGYIMVLFIFIFVMVML